MTVSSGVQNPDCAGLLRLLRRGPRAGHFSRVYRPVGDNAADGTADLGIGHLRLGGLQLGTRGLHLRLRAFDLLLFTGAIEGAEVLLGRLQLGLRLSVGQIGIIHHLARQRAFLEKIPAVLQHYSRGIRSLLGGSDIRLSLGHLVWDIGGSGGSLVGYRLVYLASGLHHGGSEIAVFQRGE
jgi:hypothetical protein